MSQAKQRLDQAVVSRGLALTRSQAENSIRLGYIQVDKKVIQKPGYFVAPSAVITNIAKEIYVSRAGLKLASVAQLLKLDFNGKVVLDVGSSTGGFTDYALQHGAKKVFAVDVGTQQLHPSLRGNTKISLHEQTDIRNFKPTEHIDVVVIDVSFISLRDVLPHIATIISKKTLVVAMCKPQFEAGAGSKHHGVIKNDAMRRRILRDFETWVKQYFIVLHKADSDIKGAKGNIERFYLLKI
ncbi:MAG TPA: TlyA family RNA methyltransferase [Candidatus Saccharibacteria bacterium]|nr:TlyA family RNA methyltransferase [Candidatus Saccharibacteria bacterium]